MRQKTNGKKQEKKEGWTGNKTNHEEGGEREREGNETRGKEIVRGKKQNDLITITIWICRRANKINNN